MDWWSGHSFIIGALIFNGEIRQNTVYIVQVASPSYSNIKLANHP